MTDTDDPGPSRGRDPSLPIGPEILVSDEQQVRIDPEAFAAATRRGLAWLGMPEDATLSVTLVTRERIADLKFAAFGEHRETDVLAFPIDGLTATGPGPHVVGDLVLCPEVAIDQALALGIEPEAEIGALLAHGLLHLIGEDHQGDRAEVAMAERQALLAAAIRGPA